MADISSTENDGACWRNIVQYVNDGCSANDGRCAVILPGQGRCGGIV